MVPDYLLFSFYRRKRDAERLSNKCRITQQARSELGFIPSLLRRPRLGS